ncbi:hypothetical protein AiwAL_17270 [Acidiphilium sp. AL]|uniref:IclR family transcriptional regulator domain-containing protein n=1 Tax=Acidiphilium sp. AL TaxID=2871704 RepID=UPI0021CB447B|nr:helix-turn-helix domain-containing protein [Acidiphilium sp. AL]MCU4161829.1 hypothetical protein [Acidiphilium sp. AL]
MDERGLLAGHDDGLDGKSGGGPGVDAQARTSVFVHSFGVLAYVMKVRRPVSSTEIADHLKLLKPNVYRMIEQFEVQDFLYRKFITRRVTAGLRLADFAFDVLRSSVQYAPRRQILSTQVAEVGETCNVGRLDGNRIIYFDRVEATDWPLRLYFSIGSWVPLHCTAIGELFPAFLPDQKRATLLDQLETDAVDLDDDYNDRCAGGGTHCRSSPPAISTMTGSPPAFRSGPARPAIRDRRRRPDDWLDDRGCAARARPGREDRCGDLRRRGRRHDGGRSRRICTLVECPSRRHRRRLGGSYASKKASLKAAGVTVVDTPHGIVEALTALLPVLA